MKYYLALGSNMGDRLRNLKKAIEFLQSIGEVPAISSIYESEPVDMEDTTINFYNLVLSFSCNLSPMDLIKEIKVFEEKMGRDIKQIQNKPREIDIDILLAEDKCVKNKELTIPHPQIHRRNFVLIPLLEIAPTGNHPGLKMSFKQMAKKLKPVEGIKKLPLKLIVP